MLHRKLSIHRIVLLTVIMLLMAVPTHTQTTAQGPSDTPRTAYEALDLSTPTASFDTWLDALRTGTYDTVFWLLAPDVHEEYAGRLLHNQDLVAFFSTEPDPPRLSDIAATQGFDGVITSGDSNYNVFRVLMQYAADTNTFPIDLRGAVEPGEPQPTTNLPENPYPDSMDIPLTIDGNAGFTAVMVQTVVDEWKLSKVIAPDSDPTSPGLFAAPEGGTALAANVPALPDGPRTLFDSLPLETPFGAALAFITAWAEQDYLTAYYVLSTESQEQFINAVSRGFGSSILLGSPANPGWFAPYADAETLFQNGAPLGRPNSLDYYSTEFARVFDSVMYYAVNNDWLAWPLTVGQLDTLSLTDETTSMVERLWADTPIEATTYMVTVAGEEVYQIRLTPYADGRWRVDQFTAPGIDTSNERFYTSGGLFAVQYYGIAGIEAQTPINPTITPGGEPLLTAEGTPLELPLDTDESGADLLNVGDIAEVEGVLWLGLYTTQGLGYVPFADVTLAHPHQIRFPEQFAPATEE